MLFRGADLTGKILGSAENVLETFGGGKLTANELKKDVLTQLSDINHSFIVFLDDLDRLEPAQAVEVVRLVRSVADFPKIVYLMCYDRDVLANGLKTGLNVEDGDLFLQKIVQLTFQIPLLEPFDLRQQFLESAKQLYENVRGEPLNADSLSDLAGAVSSAGGNLSTPREVKLALNAIRFTCPAIVSDVYFPDLCWLQLLKITRRDLYRWLEEYLSVRSVLVTGEAHLGEGEKASFGDRLAKLLPSEDYTSSDSIYGVGAYIPGLSANDKSEERVFGPCYRQDEEKAVVGRRIGSPVHYRYYFALTGPKAIMSDVELDENLELAKVDPYAFRVRLQQYAEELDSSKISQFLFRLDKEVLATGDVDTLKGLVEGFADVMDVVLENQKETGIYMISLDSHIGHFVRSCLKRIGELDSEGKVEVASKIVEEGRAMNWVVSEFVRDQLYRHGRVGDRAKRPEELIFTEDELDELIDKIRLRMRQEENKNKIGEMPKLGRYLYSWKEIVGDDKEVIAWVEDFCKCDAGFVKLMNSLRHQVSSDHVYYPLSEKSVSTFIDFDEAKLRLESMKEGEMTEEAIDLLHAIDLDRN